MLIKTKATQQEIFFNIIGMLSEGLELGLMLCSGLDIQLFREFQIVGFQFSAPFLISKLPQAENLNQNLSKML